MAVRLEHFIWEDGDLVERPLPEFLKRVLDEQGAGEEQDQKDE